MIQSTLFEETSPAERWDLDATKRALDDLFVSARQYKSSHSYLQLIRFIKRFRFYAPYNAMLLHIQMPGAKFVAPANRWTRDYGRSLKPNARPLVILQPMGPVMFVFDVSETEVGIDSRPLPKEIEKPFEVRSGYIGHQLEQTIENAKRDGVRVSMDKQGSQSAGRIYKVLNGNELEPLLFRIGIDKYRKPIFAKIPVQYDIVININNLSRAAIYATIVHELAHLYCGHLGTPNKKWWPDRKWLTHEFAEFEAESLTYLICARAGIDNPSDGYLAGYLRNNEEIPNISLECIVKFAGLIEQMGKSRMILRKDK